MDVPRAVFACHQGGRLQAVINVTSNAAPPSTDAVAVWVGSDEATVDSVTDTLIGWDVGFTVDEVTVDPGAWAYACWWTDGDAVWPVAAGTVIVLPGPPDGWRNPPPAS